MSQQTKKLDEIFHSDASMLGKLIHKAQVITDLNRTVQQTLDSNLKDRYQIAGFDNGVLTFLTDNSATATQIRYQVPEILSQLRKEPQWAGLISIQVKVHHNWHEFVKTKQPPPPKPSHEIVPQGAKETLEKLIESLSDDPKNDVIIKSLQKLLKK